jgi:hypothetical protein
LRRWMRVFFSSLRCFFLAIRLRRFLMTEPTDNPHSLLDNPRASGVVRVQTTVERQQTTRRAASAEIRSPVPGRRIAYAVSRPT